MELINKENMLKEEELANVVGGSCQIMSSGNGYSVSGYSPRWSVGDVLRIYYNDSYSGNHKAKCTVRGVSSTRNGGLSGQEFTYTIQIVWLPASCSAASDVGRVYYNVAESSLSL